MLRGTHIFIVVAVALGSATTVVNCYLVARGREVRRGLAVVVLIVTLALSTMLGTGAN